MGKNEYFCGWYFKCQSETDSIALIPAIHNSNGHKTCSLQIISALESLSLPVPVEHCNIQTSRPFAKLGNSLFSQAGIHIDLHTDGFSATGSLSFNDLTPIGYDIMGPFALVPFMECRHSVFSMHHQVNGILRLNGTNHIFTKGTGYIEGDRGRSFPREYLWTHCCFDGVSLMLSAGEIPIGSMHFTGVIGIIALSGKKYRLATYLGARAVHIKNGKIVIRQGNLTFTAALISPNSHSLKAPQCGAMTRTIKENLVCRARYRLLQNGRVIFDFESNTASFEYEYPS